MSSVFDKSYCGDRPNQRLMSKRGNKRNREWRKQAVVRLIGKGVGLLERW